ncbi:MAG: hypothetical protein EHM50_06195 [Lysobacterales bacterium]|nr:MAG: hypothetical protein EHM50_06195 [Xanthomonadales bacterium]
MLERFCCGEERVKFSIRLMASLVAFVAFSAEGADVTGDWAATIVTAVGERDYTYVFRQNGAKLIGTARSQDGVVAISNGFVNNKTITFDENVTVEGRRAVLEYTGELVSDTEIKFKRQVKGAPSSVIQFVATRGGTSPR